MEKKSFKVSYDSDEDIISLHSEGAKSKFSFDLELPKGDVVIDYGFDGSVVGLEFFNASNYFPFLKKVKNSTKLNGRFSVQYGRNWAQISFTISAPGIPNQVNNSIISPYNKRMILSH
ncbi:MAG: hypothetical protein UR98_C0005G0008 [Parcubacteria group bacterium GW2011_GWA1_36_12]|nr:MAG: hypothetical protein UR98_C0005G0008 [Parcubacteria group bacterium GW2011_GWA1_36_12]